MKRSRRTTMSPHGAPPTFARMVAQNKKISAGGNQPGALVMFISATEVLIPRPSSNAKIISRPQNKPQHQSRTPDETKTARPHRTNRASVLAMLKPAPSS